MLVGRTGVVYVIRARRDRRVDLMLLAQGCRNR